MGIIAEKVECKHDTAYPFPRFWNLDFVSKRSILRFCSMSLYLFFSVSAKSATDVVSKVFTLTLLFKTNMIPIVFLKRLEKIGRLFVHCLKDFPNLKRIIYWSYTVIFVPQKTIWMGNNSRWWSKNISSRLQANVYIRKLTVSDNVCSAIGTTSSKIPALYRYTETIPKISLISTVVQRWSHEDVFAR